MAEPTLFFKLEDPDFEILKKTGALVVFDTETQEEVGEFDYPEDLIKSYQPSLNSNLQKEAQNEGLNPDSYKIKSFLVLAKNEDDVNDLGFLENEDAIIVASVDIGESEVNGANKEWHLYLLGVLE